MSVKPVRPFPPGHYQSRPPPRDSLKRLCCLIEPWMWEAADHCAGQTGQPISAIIRSWLTPKAEAWAATHDLSGPPDTESDPPAR